MIGVFVAYIDIGSPVPNFTTKSCGLADKNKSPVPNFTSKSCGLADKNKKAFDGIEMIQNKSVVFFVVQNSVWLSLYNSSIM